MRLLILAILLFACKSTEKLSEDSIYVCTDDELELLAENNRRIFTEDSKLVLSNFTEQVSSSIDSLVSNNVVVLEDEFKYEELKNKLSIQSSRYSYHDPHLSTLLREVKSNIERHIEIKENSKPIISTKPSFNPNAEIYLPQLPNCSRRIIYINEGVSLNLYRIPRALTNLVPIEYSINKTKSDYDKYFVDHVYDIIPELGSLWKNQWDTDIKLDNLELFEMLNGIYHFLVSHEYFHDLKNHEGSSRAISFGNNDTIDEVLYNWAQELEADYYASELQVQLLRDKSIQIKFPELFKWGYEYFFTFSEMFSFLQKQEITGEVFEKRLNQLKLEYYDEGKNKLDIKRELLESFRKMRETNLNLYKTELDKIEYVDLEEQVIEVNKLLPNKPTLRDFITLLDDLEIEIIDKETHPPANLRRIICRTALLRTKKINPHKFNYGDIYWYALNKSNKLLSEILMDYEIDETLVDNYLMK